MQPVVDRFYMEAVLHGFKNPVTPDDCFKDLSRHQRLVEDVRLDKILDETEKLCKKMIYLSYK